MLFVILLLFAPVMAIVCCIGDWGRQKWLEWAGMTGGALLIKVLYAMYLGVMIAVASVLTAIGQAMGGWELEWILFAALWIIAFASRGKLMGLFSPGGHHEHHPGLTAATAALPAIMVARAGARTGRAVVTSSGRTAVAAGRYARDRRVEQRDLERYQPTHARYEEHSTEQLASRAEAAEGANDRSNQRAEQMQGASFNEEQAQIHTARAALASAPAGESRDLASTRAFLRCHTLHGPERPRTPQGPRSQKRSERWPGARQRRSARGRCWATRASRWLWVPSR
jgi:hypothetical protein